MSEHFLISQPTEGETAVGAPMHIAFPKTFTIESARRRDSVPPLSSPISDGRQIAIGFRTLSIHVTDQKAKKVTVKPGSAEEEISKFDFHLVTVDEIHQRFNSTPERGLEQSAASSRLQRYGKNIITPPKDDVFLKLLGYLFGGFCPLLWTAALVCFLAWQPLGTPPDPLNLYLAIVLILVILLQAAFTAYQDWTTAKVMSSINSLLPAEAMVIRDNIRQKVPTPNLVAGDIVVLSLGTKVPADLRLVFVTEDLKFDRSILTGEVDPVSGSINATDDNYLETRNIALTGTLVTNGAATGIVVTTGDKTVMGRIAQLSAGQAPEPPLLQMEIMRFVRIVIVLAVVTAIIVLVVWAAWLRTIYPTFLSLSAILVNVIGIMVAFVPEGMPVTVTLTLTAVARQMAKHKILCKVLTTVETLGSVNVIASDKTGTLTENKMFVTRIGFTESEPQGIATKDCRHILVARTNRDLTLLVRQLRTAAALCNGASFDLKTLDQPVYQRKTNGDATDSALLRFAEDLKIDDNDSDFEKIHEIPFNSRNKWMLSLYRCKDSKASKQLPVSDARQVNAFNCGNGDLVMITKGAPDVLLPKCSSYLDASGNQKELTGNAIDNITKLQEHWSGDGQRVLILTRRIFTDDKDLPRSVDDYTSLSDVIEKASTNLTVIGLIGIVDPPRPEIKDVIARCRLAGIRVFMVTGDFRLTAAAIAKQVGIFSPNARIDDFENIQSAGTQTYRNEDDPSTDYNAQVTSLIMTGLDLAGGNLTDDHWDKIANYSEVVFARTTPEQKLRIVTEFRKRGNIVGVTGDGVNDAPALKAAHIGVAMGAGSEVAMAASAMILLDSNFSSMLVAIEYGRLVFENLKKVILYLLPAGSWSELWPVLFNVFFGLPLPLSTFLMIIICLFTDLFPSLAIINEMPESDLMLRKPRNPKKERLVDAKLLFHAYGFIGCMETACALGMYFQYLTSNGGFAGSDLFLVFDQWTDGYKGKTQVELNELLYTAQSVYFLTLVILQFGNLIATRTRYTSLVKSNPWKTNPYLFAAMFASAAVAVVVLYIPFFNNAFNTRPVSYAYWLIPLGLAVGIVIMEELRKLAVVSFPRSIVARMAW